MGPVRVARTVGVANPFRAGAPFGLGTPVRYARTELGHQAGDAHDERSTLDSWQKIELSGRPAEPRQSRLALQMMAELKPRAKVDGAGGPISIHTLKQRESEIDYGGAPTCPGELVYFPFLEQFF